MNETKLCGNKRIRPMISNESYNETAPQKKKRKLSDNKKSNAIVQYKPSNILSVNSNQSKLLNEDEKIYIKTFFNKYTKKERKILNTLYPKYVIEEKIKLLKVLLNMCLKKAKNIVYKLNDKYEIVSAIKYMMKKIKQKYSANKTHMCLSIINKNSYDLYLKSMPIDSIEIIKNSFKEYFRDMFCIAENKIKCLIWDQDLKDKYKNTIKNAFSDYNRNKIPLLQNCDLNNNNKNNILIEILNSTKHISTECDRIQKERDNEKNKKKEIEKRNRCVPQYVNKPEYYQMSNNRNANNNNNKSYINSPTPYNEYNTLRNTLNNNNNMFDTTGNSFTMIYREVTTIYIQQY